jgi:hypothetical protein
MKRFGGEEIEIYGLPVPQSQRQAGIPIQNKIARNVF